MSAGARDISQTDQLLMWKPGDSQLTLEQMRGAQEYFAKKCREDEAARLEQQKVATHEGQERRSARWRQRISRGIATVACIAAGSIVLAPGVGALDRTGAAFTRSADVVAAVPVANGSEAAKSRIVDVYKQIDANGIKSLKDEADRYRQIHADAFVDVGLCADAEHRVGEATSGEEVAKVLSDITKQYGVSDVSVDTDVALGDAQDIARAVIHSLSSLPKDFVSQQTTFKNVEIAPPMQKPGKDGVGRLGSMSTSGTMTLYSLSLGEKIAQPFAGVMAQPLSYSETFFHELAHAFQYRQKYPDSRYQGKLPSGPLEIAGDIGRNAIGIPEVSSLYAREGGSELGAEDMAGLFTTTATSLPSPSNWRRFGSRLTQQQLFTLADVEKAYPGMALLLIADRAE